MKLGAFSISLAVKDLGVSKEFYEKLGFKVLNGALDKKYLIMKSGDSLIGLFEGMFDNNILTFNPGWDSSGQNTNDFDDVRSIEKELESKGIKLIQKTDAGKAGPAHIVLKDPDGNDILIDQHR